MNISLNRGRQSAKSDGSVLRRLAQRLGGRVSASVGTSACAAIGAAQHAAHESTLSEARSLAEQSQERSGALRASLMARPGSDEVVLAHGVPYDDVRFGFDAASPHDGAIVAVQVSAGGHMRVLHLGDARPAGWPGAEELAEIGRRVDRRELEQLDQDLEPLEPTREDLEAVRRFARELRESEPSDPDVDPLGAGYWDTVEKAGHRARRQQDALRSAANGPKIEMAMHVLVPDDDGPMRTACCARLLEELPFTEGATRDANECTCPAAWT